MHSGIKYSFGNHSDVGKKRKINQDSFGTAKNDWGEIFIVADGMGGHKGGEVASKITVDHMCNAFKIASKDTPPAVFLERTINITTYALCGFANFSSIAIQVGGIGSLEPSRKSDFAKCGFKALIGATLAGFMTACLAGIFI